MNHDVNDARPSPIQPYFIFWVWVDGIARVIKFGVRTWLTLVS